MLAQLVTALLAFASRVKLEDPKDYTPLPTRTVYSTQSVDGWKRKCDNTCTSAGGGKYGNDGDCDDGGLGSEYSHCAAGTDCYDCSNDALPPCVEPIWVDSPKGTPQNDGNRRRSPEGWTRMDGGGQGPGDAKGCFTNPQGRHALK